MKWRKVVLTVGGAFAGAVVAKKAARAAIGVAKRALRPPRFHGQEALVGRECTITTLKVDGLFGQASYQDGGAGLLLSVRCDKANDLTRGRVARIVAYHEGSGTYEVEAI